MNWLSTNYQWIVGVVAMPIILLLLKLWADSPKKPHESKVEKTFSNNSQKAIGSDNSQTANALAIETLTVNVGRPRRDVKAEVTHSPRLAVIDDQDEVLALQILSTLDDAFPIRLSLHELKTCLPDFAIRTDDEWRLAIDALSKMGFIDGIFPRLGFNKMLRGAANLQITETGREHSGQTKSEMTEYIRSASPYLTS